jgi:ATP-dependent Clp protease ATP-binding subunit ClpB
MIPFAERDRLNSIKDLKKRLEEAKHGLEVAQRAGHYEKASQLRFATIPDLQRQLPNETETKNKELEDEGKLGGMLHDRVTSDDIARVVAKATGIPVTNLLKGERDKLVHVSGAVKLGSLFGSDAAID